MQRSVEKEKSIYLLNLLAEAFTGKDLFQTDKKDQSRKLKFAFPMAFWAPNARRVFTLPATPYKRYRRCQTTRPVDY